MKVSERQRELYGERKQRKPRAVPDVRPEPFHSQTSSHRTSKLRTTRCYNITSQASADDVNVTALPRARFGNGVIFLQRVPQAGPLSVPRAATSRRRRRAAETGRSGRRTSAARRRL